MESQSWIDRKTLLLSVKVEAKVFSVLAFYGAWGTDTKGHGLRTNNDKFDPHQRFPSLTCCVRYLTLCNGGIALAQAHIASLIIVVSQ